MIDAALVVALVIVPGIVIGYRPTGGVPGVPGVIAGIGLLVLFTLTLASDVFVAPQTMPGWLQAFVTANPISHLVTAERSLMDGHPATGQIVLVLAASAVLMAVFAPVTAWLYGRQR